MSKKSNSNRAYNRMQHHNPYVNMSNEQRYELLEDAKDGVFRIITRNKYRWGYENWVKMTTAIAMGEYATIHNIVSAFRQSQSKKSVMALVEEIELINKSMIYERK